MEKQVPQISTELVSCCNFSLDVLEEIFLKAPREMVEFGNYTDLYFLLGTEINVNCEEEQLGFMVYSLTDRNQ